MEPNKSEIKEKIRAFWDNSHQNYDAVEVHGVHSETEKEMWRQGMAKLLGQEKNIKILDIGTGTGFLALLLAEMGYNVTGADWAASKIHQAKEKAAASNIPVRFEVQDAEKLSLESNVFDAVVSRHVLWTLSEPFVAAQEWVRVTKPGGKVIVDIPRQGSHSGKHHYGDEIGEQLPLGNGADPEVLIAMFREAGLANVNLKLMEKQGEREQHRKILLICGEKL